MKLQTAIIASLAPIALFAAPLHAQTEDAGVPSVTVDVSDLDLATPEGAARLDTRMKTLINRMCAVADRSLTARKLERKCRETALAHAEPKMRFAIQQARLGSVRLASEQAPATEG